VETSNCGVPQGSILVPVLFNIFIKDIDGGIECTLRNFVDDIKLIGTVDMLEGNDAIHKGLNRLEEWACPMKFNKAKCKVVHLSEGNPQDQYRLEDEWIWNSPVEKDVRILVDEKLDMSWQRALKPRRPTVSWAAPRKAWPAG